MCICWVREITDYNMNPIKSPREILFEMAGIPSMASGGKLGTTAEMYKLITRAIEQYTKKFGRPPSPEDVQALKKHAQDISKKAEIKTDPTTQARARHQMATDPNLINPEGPDPFLTKATTGRTVKGTYIQPKAQDINDPNVQANIEMKQAAGELEDIMPESITPSADYMARTSSAMENRALAAGKTPLIDMLKAAFFKKNGRYPTDEELDVIIAEYNPMRHQYGERGASVVTERPPTARGMSDWRQQARAEGIPEAYLNKPPADYPKYLLDELAIGRGEQPGMKPMPETRINPDRPFAGGGSTTPTRREMLAEMVARNFRPQAMADGGRPRRGYQQSMDAVRDFFRGVRDAPREVIGSYADMLGIRPAPTRAPLDVSEMSAPQGRLIPFEGQGSGAYEAGKFTSGMIGDPMNALFAAPVLQGARRAITAPVRAAARNPIKTSVMLGAVPATTISAENE